MQAWPERNQLNTPQRSVRRVATYTLLCFALAGLIAGFAFGGFAQRLLSGANGNSPNANSSSPQVSQHNSPAPSATVENIPLAVPDVSAYSSAEQANGSTQYTVSAQIMNSATNTPIQTNDVTCRLWLTADQNATSDALKANNYALLTSVSKFDQPFPHEEQGALTFAASSKQVQPCAANGKTNWTHTLSNQIHKGGNYYLVILADWQGKHYNWSIRGIVVNK